METALPPNRKSTTDYIPDLKGLVDTLHENDVYAVVRIAVFQDDVLANQRSDLAVKSATTGGPWLTFQGAAWTNAYRDADAQPDMQVLKTTNKTVLKY